MSRSQKMLGVLLACVIACAALLGWVLAQDRASVNAQEQIITVDGDIITTPTDEDSITRAFADIALTIGGTGNGFVWAIAENLNMTASATVWVYIELYSSTTYQESYTTMTLEYRDSTENLEEGRSIGISASTNGQSRYWQARVRYKVASNDWVSKTTSTFHCDANGNKIS